MKKTIYTLMCLLTTAAVYAHSPYITKVWEFVPAPGQFTNELPEYESGDDAATMCAKVEELIANNAQGMISLGGWGGYVVFSFDHPVVNVAGEKDLLIQGNTFYTNQTEGAAGGGSCEPGIVMVSYDANGNGLPDDAWYELAGSEYSNPLTKHNYSVTYERTTEHADVPWTDSEQQTGVIAVNNFHMHSFYPLWIDAETLTFSGSRLPDNYELKPNSTYVLYPYAYGYADNHPNDVADARLDIGWAVNADGSPADLQAIHFVKVYTALQQQCGMLGETSTEIVGALDLHPNAPMDVDNTLVPSSCRKLIRNGQLIILHNDKAYNPLGTILNNY